MNKCTAENWRSHDEYDYEDYCGRKHGKHQNKDNWEEFTVMTSRRKSEGEKHLLFVVKIVRMKPKCVQIKPQRRRRRLKKKPQLFLKICKIKTVKPNRYASHGVLQPVSTLKRENNKMATKIKTFMIHIQQLVTQKSTDSKNCEASTQKVKEDNLKVSCKVNQQEQQPQHLDHRQDKLWDGEEDRNQELFLKSEILEMEQCSEISGRRRSKRRIKKKNKRNKNNNKKRPKSSNSKKKRESGE